MPSSLRRSLPITGAAVLMTGALALAQTHATPAPRVRPETSQTALLLEDLVHRSPTARSLLIALEQSDVVVYVRHRMFAESTLNGRTGFVRSDMPTRLLIIEIGCPRSRLEQLVALGHELQHAAEIAAAPTVAGPRAMAQYFGRIGIRTISTAAAAGATFETAAAQTVETRVRQELLSEKRSAEAESPGLERHGHERP